MNKIGIVNITYKGGIFYFNSDKFIEKLDHKSMEQILFYDDSTIDAVCETIDNHIYSDVAFVCSNSTIHLIRKIISQSTSEKKYHILNSRFKNNTYCELGDKT